MHAPIRHASSTNSGKKTPPENLDWLGGAIFYQHPNFQMDNGDPGSKYTQDETHPHHGRHDQYSSLKVAPGCQVTIYEHDNYNGHSITLPASLKETTSEYSHLNNLPSSNRSFDDMISSVEVDCDNKEFMCEHILDVNQCKDVCFGEGSKKSNECGRKLASHCSTRLDDPDCLKFCMVHENDCSANMIKKYCKNNKDKSECACINAIPKDRAEYVTAKANFGKYTKKEDGTYVEKAKGNNVCWAFDCYKDGSPNPNVLHLHSWWKYSGNCKEPKVCETWIVNSNINIDGHGQFNVDSEACGQEDDVEMESETNTNTNTDTDNSGTGLVPPDDGTTPPPLTPDEEREQNLMFLGIGILVVFIILRSTNRQVISKRS
jgi:hypothetical protein